MSAEPNSAEILDVLVKARALLARPYGWIQGQSVKVRRSGRKSYCVVGAIDAAAGADVWSVEPLVFEVLRPHAGGQRLGWWNDEPSRTKKEVLGAFDKAIESVAAHSEGSGTK